MTQQDQYLVWKEEGNVHFKNQEYEKALVSYAKALQIDQKENDKAILYKNRAACHLKTKQYEKAVRDCDNALELAPSDPKALFRRCQAHEALQRFDEAYKDAMELFKADPKNTAVQPILARLYAKIQDIAKQQSSTKNRTMQMLDYVFGSSNEDVSKRVQAANNLLVLAKEKAGADMLESEGIVEKIMTILKTEKNPDITLAFIRIIGEMCKGNPTRTKAILKQVGMPPFISCLNSGSSQQVNAGEYCLQSMINALSGMNAKKGIKPVKSLLEENKSDLHCIMKSLTHSLNSRVMSGLGRDAMLELIMKNVEYTALDWSLEFVDCDGVYRILEVASELVEYKYESSMDITESTRTNASVALQKIYDSLSCDKHRELFRERVDEFVTDKLKGPEIESKVRVTAAITSLLQGALDVGNGCIARQGVLEMILVMAGTDDVLQQMVAAEAIIAAASKKDKCSSIINIGLNILKKLYSSKNDSIRVRALVGLCKVSSFGGTDASIKPFAEGSHLKLAAACRRFLISPSRDKSLRKWASEGLSYLTLDADVKEELVQDKAAIQAIIDLAKSGDHSCVYGVVTTLVNLTNSYDKQEMIPEMIQLAKFAKQHVPTEHPKDAKEFVDKRAKTLAESGITVALVELSKTEAKSIKELISRVFNAICEHKELRGTVVQQGGAKALIPMALDSTEKGKFAASQALARIGITINPEIAFPGQRCVEIVRPILQLLHPDCSALENFEALMALCNLAQVSESVRQRIISEQGITSIESYMYEEHELLKRAATQCMVNLLLSEETIQMHEMKNDRVKYLTLLAADEDLETAKAATGALSILTSCSKKCAKKIFTAKDWLDILRTLLANEDKEIQYRGTYIVYHLMTSSRSIAEKLIETDIMELLMMLSQLNDPQSVKTKEYAAKALRGAEEWKLIKPNPGEEEEDDDDEYDRVE